MVTKHSAAPSKPTEDPHDQLSRNVDHSRLSKFQDRSDPDYEIFRQRIVDCMQIDTTGALDDDLRKKITICFPGCLQLSRQRARPSVPPRHSS